MRWDQPSTEALKVRLMTKLAPVPSPISSASTRRTTASYLLVGGVEGRVRQGDRVVREVTDSASSSGQGRLAGHGHRQQRGRVVGAGVAALP